MGVFRRQFFDIVNTSGSGEGVLNHPQRGVAIAVVVADELLQVVRPVFRAGRDVTLDHVPQRLVEALHHGLTGGAIPHAAAVFDRCQLAAGLEGSLERGEEVRAVVGLQCASGMSPAPP